MLVAAGLAGLFAMPAVAAEEQGEIRITQHREGKPIPGGNVTLCYVGTATEEGYLIMGYENDWIILADEVFFPETALWVQKHAKADGITKAVEKTGTVTFTDLEEGLYLVTQSEAVSGYAPFSPFLVELPIGGAVWLAEITPMLEPLSSENPQTGDHPAPIIAAMALVLSVFALLMLSDKRKE